MKEKFVTIRSDGTPGNTLIEIDQYSLGKVQSAKWEIKIRDVAKVEFSTILNPIELKVLQENTTMKFVFDRDYFLSNLKTLFLVWFYKIKQGERK